MRSSRWAEPWKRPPVATCSISMIRPLRGYGLSVAHSVNRMHAEAIIANEPRYYQLSHCLLRSGSPLHLNTVPGGAARLRPERKPARIHDMMMDAGRPRPPLRESQQQKCAIPPVPLTSAVFIGIARRLCINFTRQNLDLWRRRNVNARTCRTSRAGARLPSRSALAPCPGLHH